MKGSPPSLNSLFISTHLLFYMMKRRLTSGWDPNSDEEEPAWMTETPFDTLFCSTAPYQQVVTYFTLHALVEHANIAKRQAIVNWCKAVDVRLNTQSHPSVNTYIPSSRCGRMLKGSRWLATTFSSNHTTGVTPISLTFSSIRLRLEELNTIGPL